MTPNDSYKIKEFDFTFKFSQYLQAYITHLVYYVFIGPLINLYYIPMGKKKLM